MRQFLWKRVTPIAVVASILTISASYFYTHIFPYYAYRTCRSGDLRISIWKEIDMAHQEDEVFADIYIRGQFVKNVKFDTRISNSPGYVLKSVGDHAILQPEGHPDLVSLYIDTATRETYPNEKRTWFNDKFMDELRRLFGRPRLEFGGIP